MTLCDALVIWACVPHSSQGQQAASVAQSVSGMPGLQQMAKGLCLYRVGQGHFHAPKRPSRPVRVVTAICSDDTRNAANNADRDNILLSLSYMTMLRDTDSAVTCRQV